MVACVCVRVREEGGWKTESKKKLWVQGFVLAGNHAGWFLSDNIRNRCDDHNNSIDDNLKNVQ